jgi:two-component system LytT family sensor kinase
VSWWVVVGAGAAYAVFAALVSQWFTSLTGLSRWTLTPGGPSSRFVNLLAVNLVVWVGWSLLAVVVFALGRRVNMARDGWRRGLAFHAVASVVVTTIHLILGATGRWGLQTAWGLDPQWWSTVTETFLRLVDQELPVYWALLGLQHAVDYYHESRERAVRAAQLETRLVEAQLQALQQQLHPHFLFNTLHAISALVHRQPDKADEMIERLSDLLRIALDKVGVQEVTVAEEIEYLRAYLDIEQVHFGDRLEIVYRIDAHALDVLVPNLILQPLAENAIRHGLAPRAGKGRLSIEAVVDGETLVLRIADDGRGLIGGVVGRFGVGLGNTQARLERLYAGRATLACAPAAEGGCVVTVTLPVRQKEAEAERNGRPTEPAPDNPWLVPNPAFAGDAASPPRRAAR